MFFSLYYPPFVNFKNIFSYTNTTFNLKEIKEDFIFKTII